MVDLASLAAPLQFGDNRFDVKDLNHKSHKIYWIKSLLAAGSRPEMHLLAIVPLSLENHVEIAMIALYKNLGSKLVNSTSGGEGVPNPSSEVREKIGRNSGAARKGIRLSREHKDKIAAAMRGHKRSYGNHNKKGKRVSAEGRANMGIASLGRRLSEEHKRKIGSASLRSWKNEERKNRMRIFARSRRHTQESKDKIRASWVIRRLKREAIRG